MPDEIGMLITPATLNQCIKSLNLSSRIIPQTPVIRKRKSVIKSIDAAGSL